MTRFAFTDGADIYQGDNGGLGASHASFSEEQAGLGGTAEAGALLGYALAAPANGTFLVVGAPGKDNLGMHDRVELTRYAIRRGLVQP